MNGHAIIILALSLLALACEKKHDEHEPEGPLFDLQVAYDLRSEAVEAQLDTKTRWVSNTDCDSTLWTGLGAAAGLSSRIEFAEYAPGEIHRRPPPSCWNDKDGDVGSKSTVSNDMLLGTLWAYWTKGDLAALQRLAAYGENHNWQMGEPLSRPGEVVLKANQQGLLGRMIYAMSNGKDDRFYRRIFTYYAPVNADYELHLQAVGILLQGEVYRALKLQGLDAGGSALTGIDDNMLERLQELVAVSPVNPTFHVALATYTGNFARSLELLLNPETPCPTYARGERPGVLCQITWLFGARLLLKRHPSDA